MTYKVFLVEDEIVTREGIRDNVDWKSTGFEFCGEAQDGEIALPLIEKTQPDVLITDIKMPFMDGLQLCRIVRNRMPWIKIIVLSGHDEFEFAQSAIKLGVSEYLLKPISSAEIQSVLRNMATVLDRERQERARLKELQNQVKDVIALKREKLLLDLVVGGVSSLETVEQYGEFGLKLIAPYYLVILVKVNFLSHNGRLDPRVYQDVYEIVADLTDIHPGAFLTQKSVEELLLMMMGDDPEQLKEDGRFLAGLIKRDIEEKLGYSTIYGIGTVQQRLMAIHLSFSDALAAVNDLEHGPMPKSARPPEDLLEVPSLDQTAMGHYLHHGLIDEFDVFFDQHLQDICAAALRSTLVRHYVLVDIILSSAQFVASLGGKESEVIPAIGDIDSLLTNLGSPEQMKEGLRNVFAGVLAFRNEHAHMHRAELIYQAKTFIDANFADPHLLLEDVAATVNLSPSHFSTVFGRETGESFKNYLTAVRIARAKELLRSTNLKCSEIAYQSGYSDPHYFSYAFKKSTGLPPQQYRQLART
ncbi:MAG: response regulator [Candidatus Promineifilaceae bacterium]